MNSKIDTKELLDDLRTLAASAYPADTWTNLSLKQLAKRAADKIEELNFQVQGWEEDAAYLGDDLTC